MQVVRHPGRKEFDLPRCVLTMGSFDALHLGHRALLERVIESARKVEGKATVLTFEPHPLKVLAPKRAPKLLLTHKDKMRLFAEFGVDCVIIQKFDHAFARLEAREFVETYLSQRLKVYQVWVGKDFGFGRGKRGRASDLVAWGKELGFEVGLVEPVEIDGQRVSSSRIRSLIDSGAVKQANRLLGRYHFVSGRVGRGQQRGRRLGFPTANVVTRAEVMPADGIYATLLEFDGARWPSVTSIGTNPTFGEGPRTVECHVLDFDRDLYRRRVRLYFIDRIRDEQRFVSEDELVLQIKEDVARARRVFSATDAAGIGPGGERPL